jgi:hypothetical protein
MLLEELNVDHKFLIFFEFFELRESDRKPNMTISNPLATCIITCDE